MGMKNLFISFSGGETSALMTHMLLNKWRSKYAEVVVLFANTGQENEATLEFVHRCDQEFGFHTVWLEADINPVMGGGTRHKVVTYETASRDGKPFEAAIAKYGIPNSKFKHCTKELKLRPMESYLKAAKWKKGTYDTAIGIRADEPQRRSVHQESRRLVYPLLDWEPLCKPDVNSFWAEQSFRLVLAGYQGNCKTCWKKSLRKLMTIMDDDPRSFDFFERMEMTYDTVGAEFAKKHVPGYYRTFFRGNLSVRDLREAYLFDDSWERAENDAVVYSGKTVALDTDAADGCVESCEVNFG